MDDSVVRRLALIALFAVVTLLSFTVFAVYYAVSHQGMPQNYTDRVVQDAENAFNATPEDPSKAAEYARALMAAKKLDEAASVLAPFASANTTEGVAVVRIEEARLAWLRGDSDDAAERVEVAVQTVKDLRKKRRSDLDAKGITMPEEVPEQIEVALLWAEILKARGDSDGAIEALGWALEENATMSDVLTQRADLLAAAGRVDEARDDYQRALKMAPDYQPAIDGLESLDD